tara:strand:- start:259 stop:2232 length:1974 start_codon:yes stop_codon:yes gene_type:complete
MTFQVAILCAVFAALPLLQAVEPARLGEIERELAQLPQLIPSLQSSRRIGFHGHYAEPAWVTIDLGAIVTPERVVIFPARLPVVQNGTPPSTGFPAALDVEVDESAEFESPIRIARWSEAHPGEGEHLPFLSIPGNGASGRFLRVVIPNHGFRGTAGDPESLHFRLGEIVVLAEGRNVALRRPVTSSASTEQSRRWERTNLTDGYFWCLPLRGSEPSPSFGYHSATHSRAVPGSPLWVEIDLGQEMAIDEIHVTPAHPQNIPDAEGYGFPLQFEIVADPGTGETVVLDEIENPRSSAAALPNPGAAQVMLATPGLRARRIRVNAARLNGIGSSGLIENHFLALAEIQIWQGERNLALGKKVRHADSMAGDGWSAEALVDGYGSRYELLDWSTWLKGIEEASELQAEAVTIRARMAERREIRRNRLVTATVATALLIALASACAILVMRSIAARSREALRQRLARDLHDEIGASLSHLALQSELAGQQMRRGHLEPARLDNISATARETLDHMRDVIWLLAPASGSWSEFSQRMESIGHRLLDGVTGEVSVHGKPPEGSPPIGWAREVVAFFKEALTNARRHSQAECVRAEISWTDPVLTVCIDDDGCGFDANSITETTGYGLANLRQRATKLNADLKLDSEPGNGTRIRLSIPYPKS